MAIKDVHIARTAYIIITGRVSAINLSHLTMGCLLCENIPELGMCNQAWPPLMGFIPLLLIMAIDGAYHGQWRSAKTDYVQLLHWGGIMTGHPRGVHGIKDEPLQSHPSSRGGQRQSNKSSIRADMRRWHVWKALVLKAGVCLLLSPRLQGCCWFYLPSHTGHRRGNPRICGTGGWQARGVNGWQGVEGGITQW